MENSKTNYDIVKLMILLLIACGLVACKKDEQGGIAGLPTTAPAEGDELPGNSGGDSDGESDDVAPKQTWNLSNDVSSFTVKGSQKIFNILDSDVSGRWNELNIQLDSPAGQNLPDNGGADSGFTNDNIDMSDNVLLMHFDDEASADNSSGISLTTSITGSGVSHVTGLLGGAKELDGLGDHVHVADSDELDFTNQLTMGGWFFFNNDIGNKRLIAKGLQTNSTWAYRIVTLDGGAFGFQDGLLVQLSANGVNLAVQAFSNNALNTHKNKWVHIAATYDGAILKLFINGSVVATANGVTSIFNSPEDLAIGSATNGQFALDGAIDEVMLFSRALSESDLAAIYRRGAEKVTLQVKACVSADCSDADFVGNDGTASTSISVGGGVIDLSSLNLIGRHFQVQAEVTGTVEIESLSVKGSE